MRVLVLPRYGRLGASSRLRFMQYFPWLANAGIDITVAPLFSDAYVAGLQNNSRKPGDVMLAYAGRIKALLGSGSYDLIWIEKELLPWLPAWFEKILLPRRVPYVLDYDDAVFHYYDKHNNLIIRKLLGSKHQTLMRSAALVVAGNAYLAEFARQSGASRVEVIPTVIDLERYPAASTIRMARNRAVPCIGWIGQRATASFLQPYKRLFEQLSISGQARFAAIGIDAAALGLPLESIAWTESTEVASIASFDIGIMPLLDAPFERGKCGYKLIQYMACGLPVVASPVGVNCQIVEHGVNGFLAETLEQWQHALQTLAADAGLRERMGQAGRQKIEREYCIQVTGPKLASLLTSIK
jgi:glycosyltransferase involved in cell wall biosynthesis